MGDMHRIGGAESSGSTLDLVFVHGLGGHCEETWQHPENEVGDHWMAWLAEDFPRIAVWSVGYEAAPVEWLKGSSMPLDDRARNLANLVTLHDIGSRPAVWVGHSLGGLVIKALLRYSEGRQDEEARLLENTVGTVFVATPHTGADLATWLDRLARVLRSKSAKDLTANNPLLRVLNTWYRDRATRQRIATLCYMEGRNTAGVLVVDEASADPGIPNVNPIKLDADHIEIAKPADRNDQLYLGVRRFLQQTLESPRLRAGLASTSGSRVHQEDSVHVSGPSPIIEVVTFECESEDEFQQQVQRQIKDALAQPLLEQAVKRLHGKPGSGATATEITTQRLMSQTPVKALDTWTSTVRDCMLDVTGDYHRDRKQFWKACEHVHLLWVRLFWYDEKTTGYRILGAGHARETRGI